MGLLEGINVNEGRGTQHPFKIFGTPWINADKIHKEFENLKLPGLIVRPKSFQPWSGIYRDENCHGLQLKISDASSFRPVRTGIELIQLIASLYPEYCEERSYKTRANPTGRRHLDKLTGVYNSFEKIKNKEMSNLQQDVSGWKKIISPHLLY